MNTLFDVLRAVAELLGGDRHAQALEVINRHDPEHPDYQGSGQPAQPQQAPAGPEGNLS